VKLFLMPHEPSWWVWTVTAVLLAFGISGHPEFFLVAIALSAMQTVFFLIRERGFAAYSVQIRVAYAALLLVAFLPVLRWFYWVLMVGTLARALFGYCLLSVALAHALESTRANHFRPASPHSADAFPLTITRAACRTGVSFMISLRTASMSAFATGPVVFHSLAVNSSRLTKMAA
jgi:hypothetical protein